MSNSLAQIIKKSEASFSKKAPAGMRFDKEAFFAMQLLSKNSFSVGVAQKNPDSLMGAMINVGAIGLSLNPANADAYLVPRDGAICLDISYKGLIKLATNTGSIKWVQAEIVYDSDNFEFRGIGEKPKHVSDPFAERGSPVGVYCVAKTADGDFLVSVMSASEVEQVRNTSKAKDSKFSPWTTFPMEMWKKTVIKRASKTWPKTDVKGAGALSQAIDVINQHEGLQEEYGAVSTEASDYYAQLIDKKDGMGLYVFFMNLEIEQQVKIAIEYVNLNAEPRGKGKLKAEIKALREKGQSMVFDYRDTINESTDQVEMNELVSELSDAEFNYIFSIVTPEAQEKLNATRGATQ
jgi:recombination protein RecT